MVANFTWAQRRCIHSSLLNNGPTDPNPCSSHHTSVRITVSRRRKHFFLFQWNSLVIELFQALTKKKKNRSNDSELKASILLIWNKIQGLTSILTSHLYCAVFQSNHHNSGNICKERNIQLQKFYFWEPKVKISKGHTPLRATAPKMSS